VLEVLEEITSHLDAAIVLADNVRLKEKAQVDFSEDERS
jgi:hypothetical protein